MNCRIAGSVHPNNKCGSVPRLLLRFELLDECSEMPGHRTRKGVVLVLEGSPNCCQRNVSVATGIYFAFRGIGDDVSTYPVVDPIRSSGEMRHGSLPTSPPPVPRSPSECVDHLSGSRQGEHPRSGSRVAVFFFSKKMRGTSLAGCAEIAI
jgi:hypothetical protein